MSLVILPLPWLVWSLPQLRIRISNEMEKYHLISLRSEQMLLSSKLYSHWKAIQDQPEDYMASLSFESTSELIEYLKMEYKQLNKNIIE